MTTSDVVRTKIDGDIKRQASAVLAGMGMSVSDAVRLPLTRIAGDKALPFDPFLPPNEQTVTAMREARHGKLPSFNSVDALMRDLHAKDRSAPEPASATNPANAKAHIVMNASSLARTSNATSGVIAAPA